MQSKAMKVDITPSVPIGTGGFSTGVVASAVDDRLEVNLVAIREDPGAEVFIIISCDLLYPGRALVRLFEQHFPEVDPRNLFVGASHTHYAPMTDDTKPRIGTPDPGFMVRLDECCATLAAEYAETAWTDTTVEVGQAQADHSMNRRRRRLIRVSRRPGFNKIVNAPNPGGSRDETVTAFTTHDAAGAPLAIVWNYACHPVGLPSSATISGHFATHVRTVLRRQCGAADLPVVFLQGFSGDTRPSATARVRGMRRLRSIVVGRLFGEMTHADYSAWSSSLVEVVIEALRDAKRIGFTSIVARRTEVDSSLFVVAGASEPVTFQSLQFGRSLLLVGVSAEVVSDHARWLRTVSDTDYTMCVGCTGHTFGYIPTKRMLSQGGYEAGDYCASFNLGPIQPMVEHAFREGVESVLPGSAD